jgi:hypothetical protein
MQLRGNWRALARSMVVTALKLYNWLVRTAAKLRSCDRQAAKQGEARELTLWYLGCEPMRSEIQGHASCWTQLRVSWHPHMAVMLDFRAPRARSRRRHMASVEATRPVRR